MHGYHKDILFDENENVLMENRNLNGSWNGDVVGGWVSMYVCV